MGISAAATDAHVGKTLRLKMARIKKPVIPEKFKDYYTDWHFSPAVESGGFIFVSGFTGTRPDGFIPESISEQIHEAFRKIAVSLGEAGLSLDNIIEMTTYHVGLRDQIEIFRQIKDGYLNEPYPAWTAVGISELAVEGALIEIKVVAKT